MDRARFFESRLAERAMAAGVEWRWGWRLLDQERSSTVWSLVLAGPHGRHEAGTADFLAGATGRPARIARRLGAKRVRYDHPG